MKYTIYKDELTELWIRYKYEIEAKSQEEAIEKINNECICDFVSEESLFDTEKVLDREYLNENFKKIK